MSIQAIGTGGSAVSSAGGSKAAAGTSAFDALIEQLMKEAVKTPMERAREAVLKQHGLSEQDYASLPPEKRASIDREIADAVRKAAENQMKANKERGSGLARL